MAKKHLPGETALGVGTYLLAIAAALLLSHVLAIVLAVIATLLIIVGLAGSERVQRQAPILGKLPLVEDHRFEVFPHGHVDEMMKRAVQTAISETISQLPPQASAATLAERIAGKDERRELLRLARLVHTELATCELRLGQAISVTPKGMKRPLPSEKYDEWSRSLVTADEFLLNSTLEDFYVWADHINVRLAQEAEPGGVSGIAQGFLLNHDVAEGRKRLEKAQGLLKARIRELSDV